MSKKPVLVIMAAGMGSRYGGLKQIDPVDPYGNMIIDFSIYDAKQAGFEKVIFIIKKAIDEAFREGIGRRIEKYMDGLRQRDYRFGVRTFRGVHGIREQCGIHSAVAVSYTHLDVYKRQPL